VSPPGFHTFGLDTEDIVVGYFQQAPTGIAIEPYKRDITLFDLKTGKRDSVWSFPRGTPYREQASSQSKVLVKSVWNIDMLLNFLSTCLQPKDTMCDLFAGTASASVAALLLGCNTIIVEKDGKHMQLCKQRMNVHVNKTTENMAKFEKLSKDYKNCAMDEVHFICTSVVLLMEFLIYIYIDDPLREVRQVFEYRVS